MGFLKGKRVLITGLVSSRSIAYGVAQAMHREGAELAFAYQNEKIKARVEKLIKPWDCSILLPCDVTNDEDISSLFTNLKKKWDGFDVLVHSIAFAPQDQLEGDYLEHVDRQGFAMAHDISSYSLGALAKAAYPMMAERNGAILTMTYIGSVRAVTNYNIMGVAKASLEANMRYLAASMGPKGIRVNAVSSGPIRTLAASGIKGFRKMLDFNEKVTPLRCNVTIENVGNAAAFLCSDLAAGITGETLYVDAGYHFMGIPDMSHEEE